MQSWKKKQIQEHFLIGFLVILIISIGFVFWQHLENQKQTQQQIALLDAKNFSDSVGQFRNFYASQILPALKSKNIQITHDFKAIDGTLPLPATFAKEFGRHLSAQGSSYKVKLYSDMPFSWSEDGGVNDDFGKQAMAFVRENPEQPFWRIEKVRGATYLRYAVADPLKQSCVSCHNSYIGTPKTDWKVGDVRGILEVKRPISEIYNKMDVKPQDTFFKMLFLASLALFLVFFMMHRWKKSLAHAETLLSEKDKATELMNAEIQHRSELGQQLELNEEKLRKVVDSVLDVIIVIDDKGIVLQCNQAIKPLFGYEPEELISKNINILMPEPEKSMHDNYLKRYQKTNNQTVIGSTRLMSARHKNGTVFPVDLSVSKVEINNQIQFTGLIKDVSQRVETEKALQDARDKAIESARLKSQFLANMSHEIRTPMNGIIGMTQLLLEQPLTHQQKDLAQTASDSANALLTIVNDILDFSKIEAGKMDLEYQEVELLPIVEGVIDLVVDGAYKKGLRFGYFIDCNTPKYLKVDETRLRQILLNLLGNAVKFTQKGEISVIVSYLAEDKRLEFAIKDTGVGITDKAQHRLFKAFSQADGSTTRQFGGTGLGLSISKQLTELMQGEISVQSEAGKGSTFRVVLPVKMHNTKTCLTPLKQPVNILTVMAEHTFTQKELEQFSALNINLQDVELIADMPNKIETSNIDLLAVDLGLVDLGETEALLLDRLAERFALPIAFLVTPQERNKLEKVAVIKQHYVTILKPLKYSKIELLLQQAFHQEQIPERVALQAEATPPATNNYQPDDFDILLVEDNLVNQKLASALVKKIGFEVDVANNGEEALKMMELKNYDLVLMDCQMPIKDGYDTTRELRVIEKNKRHTPVVAMTANAMKGDDQLCFAAGMDDYISKPIDQDILRTKIEHYVNLKFMK